jgi:hypothetical protein
LVVSEREGTESEQHVAVSAEKNGSDAEFGH